MRTISAEKSILGHTVTGHDAPTYTNALEANKANGNGQMH